jgi:hypothetical protein
MTHDELQSLQDPGVLDLIRAHAHEDPAGFAMRFHGRNDLPVRAMAEQIACRRKAEKKLPSLSRYPLLYTKLALEQSSGESAAGWKAGLMGGRAIIDLTGGLGIDAIFFLRRFDHVVYCERDPVLAELAAYNRRAMEVANIETVVGESADTLAGYPDDAFDWVYVDPARREEGVRSVGLEATSPDVVRLHDLMLRKAPRVCIKASPALEVSGLQEKLPALSSVIVVSVGGECKETLLMLDRGSDSGKPHSVRAVCLDEGGGVFEISSKDDGCLERVVAQAPGQWFYEPDAAIIKARLSAELAAKLGLEFLNDSVDYLTSDRFVEGFPGRSFRVVECLPFKPKAFRSQLASRGITGAAIQRRDFPLSPEQLRKQFRLGESSDVFLFFTRDASGGLVCLVCRKGEAGASPSGPCRSAAPGC